MLTTTNMSLIVWDQDADEYSHLQLAANWEAVDTHDHTPGKGVPISAAGIADHSITNIKMAPNAITTNEILDHSILGIDIADGAIGYNHLSVNVLSGIVPLGLVTAWFRPSPTIPIPFGWVICDGQTVSDHSYSGIISFSVPDLRNKFVLGAALSGTGTGTGTPPAEKDNGGSHDKSWTHVHTINGHSHIVSAHNHTVNPHTHVTTHFHTVLPHHHDIDMGGKHRHGLRVRKNAFAINVRVKDTDDADQDNTLASAYVDNVVQDAPDKQVPDSGDHDHGGKTGESDPILTSTESPVSTAASPSTTSASPPTDTVGLTTNSATLGGDIRPSFYGLLYIVKVKNPS